MEGDKEYSVSSFFRNNDEVEVNFNVTAISVLFAVMEWHKRCRQCKLDPMACVKLTFKEIK